MWEKKQVAIQAEIDSEENSFLHSPQIYNYIQNFKQFHCNAEMRPKNKRNFKFSVKWGIFQGAGE